jgi:uncharacterized coiled-coil DUF342 family protein
MIGTGTELQHKLSYEVKMIEVTKEQIDALHKEVFELENKADSLRQNLIDLQWKINALIHPD